MDEAERERLEKLLNELTRPMFIWRMAMGVINSGRKDKASDSAEKRRQKALDEVSAILKRSV